MFSWNNLVFKIIWTYTDSIVCVKIHFLLAVHSQILNNFSQLHQQVVNSWTNAKFTDLAVLAHAACLSRSNTNRMCDSLYITSS